jgi:hypothetical protein
MTQAGSILGTVHYISPEQALGEIASPRSDLYSLGVVLYEMLTGELPYDAETPVGVVMKHVSGLTRSPKDANPGVPEKLDALVAHLLSRDPEERYPDAATLAGDLERIIEDLPPVPDADRTRGSKTAGARGARTTRSGTSGRRLRTGTGGMGARSTRAPNGRRQRVGVLVAMMLVLASIGVIGFVAFGQGGLLAETRSLPEMDPSQPTSEALPPGTYETQEFDPTLSFTAAEGTRWRLAVPDAPDILELTRAESLEEVYPAITFLSAQGQEVYAPDGQERITLGPEDRTSSAPDDMVAWLRNHPLLETSEPVPVTVGGQEGVLLDISVSPGLEDYPTESCGPDDPCVFLMTTSDESGFALWADQTNRLIVLEDVEGETVILAASGPKGGFANFAPKVERLLSTVQFGDARAWFGAPETDLPANLGSGIGAATSDPVRTLPTEGSMKAGAYRTDEFEPAFSFSINNSWVANGAPEREDDLDIALKDTLALDLPSVLGFYRPQAVLDPEDPEEETLLPPPATVDEWIAWYREHPYLDAEKPVPVTIGGVSGMQIDSTVSSVPKGEDAVALWTLSGGFTVYGETGWRSRTIILEVNDKVLLVESLAKNNDRLEQLIPESRAVLDTVKWKGS